MKNSKNRAFTLIELLIVITIIGILAVALIPRITGGTARARDAQRKADLQQIATALEFYADDNGGKYPSTAGCVSANAMKLALASYLTTFPADPSSSGPSTAGFCTDGYSYYPVNTAKGYLLIAKLETTTEKAAGIYGDASLSQVDNALTAAVNMNTKLVLCSAPVSDCSTNGAVYVLGR